MITETHYHELPFTKNDLQKDPVDQFTLWFGDAKAIGEIEPTAMTLATVNKQYDVSARMVLLKSFDKNGFVFFTNYLSPKSLSIQEISKVAAVFWWPLCQRQVRITGKVTFLDQKQSDDYFHQRNKPSRIAAIVSKQSEIIPNRESLLAQFEALEKKYENSDIIDRPPYWGGYVIQHQSLEFWQGRTHRLHDRFQYTRQANDWAIVQLSP